MSGPIGFNPKKLKEGEEMAQAYRARFLAEAALEKERSRSAQLEAAVKKLEAENDRLRRALERAP